MVRHPSSAPAADTSLQPRAKVVFPLGTKLLLCIVALLVLVILFLNLSTIFLLKEDKRAYVYQSQSTTAVLTGREFGKTVRHALDTMRLGLGSFDPFKPAGPAETAGLKSIVQNQSDILYLSVVLIDTKATSTKPVTSVVRDDPTGPQINPDRFAITPEWWKILLPDLLRTGYAFINLSGTDGPPWVGILAADLKSKDSPAGMPVSLGVISMKGLGQDLHGLNLSIATRSGWLLYDTVSSALYGKANISDDPLFDLARKSNAASGASEYDHQNKHLLGSYVNLPIDVVILVRTDWQRAIRSTYTLTEKFIFLGIMAIGAAIIFAIIFSKTLTAPINKLYQATFDVAQGNFDLNLKAGSRDEIGALTQSFNDMSRHISELIVERMHKVQIENELAIASTVQQTLIPPPSFNDGKLLVHSHYRSASQCGGDWWGYFKVGNRTCVMIADATGHGFPSALMTASARSCFSVMHKLAQEHGQLSISPATMLRYADRVIYEASAARIMMTMFVAVIDFDARTIVFSNAGHNPPWLFRREGDGYKMTSLVAMGQRLGEKLDSTEFDEKTVTFGNRDILFLYTDGLLEGMNEQGEMFGKRRVRKIIEANVMGGPKKVVDELMQNFMEYNGDKPLDDDVTLAAALLLPGGESPIHGPS
jgi:serine phosphatase RsbU (regulator of sigma subunit)